MLFFYTLVSWIEIGLTIPSQMASEADSLHLKVDKKECNVSFKPSHSFTLPFAYCSAAIRILFSAHCEIFSTFFMFDIFTYP